MRIRGSKIDDNTELDSRILSVCEFGNLRDVLPALMTKSETIFSLTFRMHLEMGSISIDFPQTFS